MKQILDGFVPRAFRVKIQGKIDQKLYCKKYTAPILFLEDYRIHGPIDQPHFLSPSIHLEVQLYKLRT